MRYVCVVAAVALLSTGSGVVRAEGGFDFRDPPQGRFADDWLEIYMMGGKVGYGHTTMTRDGDTIATKTNMTIKLGRVDNPVTIEVTEFTTETVGGTPLTFGSEMNASVMKTSSKGVIQDGSVTITTSQFGMDQKKTFPFVEGAMMSWGLYRQAMLRGLEPGTKYTLPVFAPDIRIDGAVEAHTVVGAMESYESLAGTGRGQRVTVSMESPVGVIDMISWVDKQGRPLLARMVMPGVGNMELVTTDQKSALMDYIPPEIFMTTTIPAKRRIDYENASTITYRLSPKPGVGTAAAVADLPDTGPQRIVNRDDGSVDVIVSRQPRHASKTMPPPDQDALTEYLDVNLMINTKDPALRKIAKRGSRGVSAKKNPYKLADNLRRFVTDYITTKNLNIGFATASEVCRTREGDCSEHGVLLAALGRINGLPSRVVAGLAYVPLFGKQDDIFGYHMWTQFWIDGAWVDYDAALRESDCSPIRIAFGVSSLKSAGLADLSMPLLNRIGAINLDIIKIEPKQ